MSWELGFLALSSLFVLTTVVLCINIATLRKRVQSASGLSKAYLSEIESLYEKAQERELKLERVERLAKTHLEQNENFEKQRNEIWLLYRKSGVQAGRAQEWLIRELSNHVKLLNKYRQEKGEKPLTVDANLQDLVEDFAINHGTKRPETSPEDLGS